MADVPQFGIDLVANDKTGPGAKSAEKRLGQIPKHASATTRKFAEETDRTIGRSSKAILKTFADVEKASAKMFSGSSITSGLTGRLGGITQAASALGSGLGEASVAGGLLEGSLTAVGVVAAGTIGVMAAAAYGAFKLADGWAKGAASIGRTAEIIGVGTKALQEFEAASQRAGLKEGAGTGALGGLSQTLNDARYGRNGQALAVLGKMGVALKTKADGTVDVDAMLPAIADALARQNSSGRRTAAGALGIPVDALPVFTQGGRALGADMRSADTTAPMVSDADVALGKRMQRRHVMAGQIIQRDTVSAGGRATAGLLDEGETLAIGLFSGSVSRDFVPSARINRDAAEKMDRAAGRIEQASGTPPPMNASQNEKALFARTYFERQGWSREQASGMVGNLLRESKLNPSAVGDSGHAFGIGQWHEDRQARFRQLYGHDIRQGSLIEQLGLVQYEMTHVGYLGGAKLRGATDPYEAGAIVSRNYERPADRDGEAQARGRLAEQVAAIPEIPVKVEVHLIGGRNGDRVNVAAGRGSRPAISRAMHHPDENWR